MKCTVCGYVFEDGKQYCPLCGTRAGSFSFTTQSEASKQNNGNASSEDKDFSWNTFDFPKPKNFRDITMRWPSFQAPAEDKEGGEEFSWDSKAAKQPVKETVEMDWSYKPQAESAKAIEVPVFAEAEKEAPRELTVEPVQTKKEMPAAVSEDGTWHLSMNALDQFAKNSVVDDSEIYKRTVAPQISEEEKTWKATVQSANTRIQQVYELDKQKFNADVWNSRPNAIKELEEQLAAADKKNAEPRETEAEIEVSAAEIPAAEPSVEIPAAEPAEVEVPEAETIAVPAEDPEAAAAEEETAQPEETAEALAPADDMPADIAEALDESLAEDDGDDSFDISDLLDMPVGTRIADPTIQMEPVTEAMMERSNVEFEPLITEETAELQPEVVEEAAAEAEPVVEAAPAIEEPVAEEASAPAEEPAEDSAPEAEEIPAASAAEESESKQEEDSFENSGFKVVEFDPEYPVWPKNHSTKATVRVEEPMDWGSAMHEAAKKTAQESAAKLGLTAVGSVVIEDTSDALDTIDSILAAAAEKKAEEAEKPAEAEPIRPVEVSPIKKETESEMKTIDSDWLKSQIEYESPLDSYGYNSRPIKEGEEKRPERFLTFARKNEEFQQLLNQEYERMRSMHDGDEDEFTPPAGAKQQNMRIDAPDIDAITIPEAAKPAETKAPAVKTPSSSKLGDDFVEITSSMGENAFKKNTVELKLAEMRAKEEAEAKHRSDRRKKLDEMKKAREAFFALQDEENSENKQEEVPQTEAAPIEEKAEEAETVKTEAPETSAPENTEAAEKKAEETPVQKKVEDDDDDERKGHPILGFFATILIIGCIAEGAVVGMRHFIPDHPATEIATQMEEAFFDAAKAGVNFLKDKGTELYYKVTKKEAPSSVVDNVNDGVDLAAIAAAVNKNIGTITRSEDLKYTASIVTDVANLESCAVVEDTKVKEAVYKTMIGYNSSWVDYVNSADKTVFDYLKADRAAYRSAANFTADGKTETFNSLELGEIRSYGGGVYVFAKESITVKESGVSKSASYNMIYDLEPVGDEYKIVSYASFK